MVLKVRKPLSSEVESMRAGALLICLMEACEADALQQLGRLDEALQASDRALQYVGPTVENLRQRGEDYHYAVGSGNTVRWKLDVTAGSPQVLDIAATWVGGLNRATNATYTVKDDLGNVLLTAEVDQNFHPDDFENDGTMWEQLGTVLLDAGRQLFVELTTDGADGYVHADAVLASQANRPQMMVFDNGPGAGIDIGLEQPSAEATLADIAGRYVTVDIDRQAAARF